MASHVFAIKVPAKPGTPRYLGANAKVVPYAHLTLQYKCVIYIYMFYLITIQDFSKPQ
jgi:hypothetical protein